MAFNGFYFDWKWWSGGATVTRTFDKLGKVNVFAFGALTVIEVSGGQGFAYVGISGADIIDPNTGRGINTSLMTSQGTPSPSFAAAGVESVTWLLGSKIPNLGTPVETIKFASANMNMLLWT